MNPDALEIVQAFIHTHPEAAARELESQTPEHAAQLLDTLSQAAARKLQPFILSPFMGRLCSYLPGEKVADILKDVSVSRCSMVLRCVSKQKCKEILDALPENIATLSRLMLSYSEDSVGAHMEADILLFTADLHVEQALDRLREAYGFAEADYLPVVDSEQRPVARVCVRELLRAKPGTSLLHLLEKALPTISSRLGLSTSVCSDAFREYNSVWVVNRNKQLVGILGHAERIKALSRVEPRKTEKTKHDVIDSFGSAYGGTLLALLDLFRPQESATLPALPPQVSPGVSGVEHD